LKVRELCANADWEISRWIRRRIVLLRLRVARRQ
jgi:hypothetical protein